jgi:heme A synthase
MDNQQTTPRRRSLLWTLLIILNTFVLGGCLALLIVNRLLQRQLDVYTSSQSMAAGSTILDFMDDLLPLYLICGSVLLLLLLLTTAVWAWTKTQSRFLRYGTLTLILLALALLLGIWLIGSNSEPITQPTTPTPTLST